MLRKVLGLQFCFGFTILFGGLARAQLLEFCPEFTLRLLFQGKTAPQYHFISFYLYLYHFICLFIYIYYLFIFISF